MKHANYNITFAQWNTRVSSFCYVEPGYSQWSLGRLCYQAWAVVRCPGNRGQQGKSSEILPFQGLYVHAKNIQASFLFLTRVIPPLLQKSLWYVLVSVIESSWWSAFILGWCFSSSLTWWAFANALQMVLFAVGRSCRHIHPSILLSQLFFAI